MLWTHHNNVLEDSWHVVAYLLTVSRISKVDYQNKVLPNIYINVSVFKNTYVVSSPG